MAGVNPFFFFFAIGVSMAEGFRALSGFAFFFFFLSFPPLFFSCVCFSEICLDDPCAGGRYDDRSFVKMKRWGEKRQVLLYW